MKFEKFTVKSREAIADAQQLAGKLGNPEIRAGHVLIALLQQENGIVPSVLRRVGADPELMQGEVAKLVDGYSKVRGGSQAMPSTDFQAALVAAENESKKLGDTHVS